ncbi:MAG: hypothetical protein JOZ07_16210 [Solirubrobacterales bacterium]|nr:hypothetical protein [Solirubrobacterales bacterium]
MADRYRTRLSVYREVACLIVKPSGAAVVVGAAPPGAWAAQRPVLERAITGFAAS